MEVNFHFVLLLNAREMANSRIGKLENCRIAELGQLGQQRNTQAVSHIEFDIIAIDYRHEFEFSSSELCKAGLEKNVEQAKGN